MLRQLRPWYTSLNREDAWIIRKSSDCELEEAAEPEMGDAGVVVVGELQC